MKLLRMPKGYRAGEAVPTSGVYSVSHKPHMLPREVTLIRRQSFPPCARCGAEVRFQLLRAKPAVELAISPVILYQLPVLDDEEAA